MKNRFIASIFAGVILFGVGCNTSVVRSSPPVAGQVSSDGSRVVANLEGDNWGIFLFYYIPLWSGEPNHPNERDYATFQNKIKNKYTIEMLKKRAKQLKAEVQDVQISDSSTGFFSLWILWRRSQSATAVAVKRK
ncbi:MAG: hypothetical protein LBM70_07655 [Victivallales bacterium]|jgi:hypothetical protein|nr:hypothetical protein [Victivallales bacterium]